MRDADHPHPGIPLGVAVRRELLEVGAVVLDGNSRIMGAQPGLLGQLAGCRLRQVLVGPYEASRERPASLERRFAPAYRQRAQGMATHGQHDQVHGDGEGRKG